MASPITWQNVNNLQGYGVASEALEASRNSVTDGLSMIGQSMNNYVEDERQQNTDAFLNQLNNYKDAKELNTAIESGGIQQLRDSFGLLDQKATRNAGTNRLDSLRAADEKALVTQDRVFDREDAATARTKAKLQQAAAPILDEATSLGAQGKFAEGRQLLEANSAALIDAGVYGRAQQGITSTQNTWETQQIQQSTSKENRDFTREQRQEVRDRKARVNKVNSLMNASVSNYKTMGANRVTYNVGDEVPNGNVNGDTPTHTQTIRDTMDTITQEFPNLTPSERSAMRADLNQQLGDASGLAERERDSLNNQISQVDLQLIGNDYHIAAGTTASARAESIIANALELNTELNEEFNDSDFVGNRKEITSLIHKAVREGSIDVPSSDGGTVKVAISDAIISQALSNFRASTFSPADEDNVLKSIQELAQSESNIEELNRYQSDKAAKTDLNKLLRGGSTAITAKGADGKFRVTYGSAYEEALAKRTKVPDILPNNISPTSSIMGGQRN